MRAQSIRPHDSIVVGLIRMDFDTLILAEIKSAGETDASHIAYGLYHDCDEVADQYPSYDCDALMRRVYRALNELRERGLIAVTDEYAWLDEHATSRSRIVWITGDGLAQIA